MTYKKNLICQKCVTVRCVTSFPYCILILETLNKTPVSYPGPLGHLVLCFHRLPLKTPAIVSGATSRTTNSKSTRNKTGKSTRKKKTEKPDDDMTPKAKPFVKSSKKSMKKSKEVNFFIFKSTE